MGGLRSVLASPRVYELWSRLVGGEAGRSTLVREYVRPSPGARVLDLGCGPGELVHLLGDVEYVGVDVSERYIAAARESVGGRAEFRVGDATNLDRDLRGFDLVLALGLIHHLDDESSRRVLNAARAALRSGGRFVSVDPTVTSGSRAAARLLVSWDRGGHVRGPAEYERLARSVFELVRCDVRQDLLRVPYTHCLLECSAPASTDE
jgi:SAM-dependent methyltransferase